ncbi:MAG: DUF1007 family protein [Paracoccaceae bacterium]
MGYATLVTKSNLKRYARIAWALFATSLSTAEAHPHMWIDLKSEIIIQDQTLVSAIYQEWLFDDFFSASLIEEASQNPKGREVGIKAVVEEILDNLEPHDYFTLINVNGKKISSNPIKSFEVDVRENRVWVSFSLPISKEVDIAAQSLAYSVFDPTFYIEMLHFEGETVSFTGDVPTSCSTKIKQPNPSTEAVLLSRSPDLDKVPNQSIGRLFAETVVVNCR